MPYIESLSTIGACIGKIGALKTKGTSLAYYTSKYGDAVGHIYMMCHGPKLQYILIR